MIEDFFRHKCDIYPGTIGKSPGAYGLPSVNEIFTYPDVPALLDISCLFSYDETVVIENEPKNTFQGANEIALPVGTNIKRGDKVVDKRNGLAYTAGYPDDIRGKYIHVPLRRGSRQEAL